ncbi:NAD(P)H-dependent flavin oxidoreductase [Culicoidibacter larvae]|uniref:Probable nitronate monooxygenase n=1 Tax=Culicoidibacter larvae TaxID=2579976 RepID=A0A5R8QCW8_9FIRM|nr:nitronate monooxygenase family protein [Culicoidibacter larvae]TLG72952.1 nitronate monooxygenase [Culicoidibacter larvae]
MKGIRIGQYEIEKPIVQGGMGLGISWDSLAGNVSANGGLGTISSVGTGYYQEGRFAKKLVKGRPFDTENLYNAEALKEIFKNARKICGDKPLACNILRAINDYDRVVGDAIAAGANIIVTGAGLPLNLATLVADHPQVEIVPIVSSDRALKIICSRWQRAGRLPGAVIVEGPLSGGHQGAKMEELELPEHQLEAILPPIVEERDKWGDFPIIVAGGVWDNDDIKRLMALGADAVQLGTRFAATYESDASQGFKDVLLNATNDDIIYVKSPVGYPGRAVRTPLTTDLQPNPKIQCISNCVQPCDKAKGARQVGFCIADSLADAQAGKYETGLFFTGANGYRVDKLYHVDELINELMGE